MGLLAEREGFEPSERLRAQRFSRPPRSTTPAPLRLKDVVIPVGASYLAIQPLAGKSQDAVKARINVDLQAIVRITPRHCAGPG